jgi:O-antigen/teichoic acid export membrane protein
MRSAGPAITLNPRQVFNRLKGDPVLRNSAIFLSGSVLAGLFGYVFHFETGRLLGPSGYAVVAAAIAALYLLTLPVIGLQLVSARFTSISIAQGRPSAVLPMVLRITGFSVLGAVPVLVLLVIFSGPVARFLNLSDNRVVYLLALATLSTLVVTINRGALQGLRRFIALSGNLLLDMASRLVLAAAFIGLAFGALGAVAAIMLGPAIAYAQSFFFLRRTTGGGDLAGKIEGLGGYALLATLTSVGMNFLFSADTLLAKHYLAADSAGIYASASVLARVIYFLALAVAGVMFPEVAALHARDEAHFHVVDLSLLLVGVMGVALIGAYFLFPGLVLLPYGASFAPAKSYLGVFAVALTLLALSNLLINYFLSIARRSFIIPLFGACILETVLIVLFHSSIGQILTMVVLTVGLMFAVVGLLYATDRFQWRSARA